MSYVATYVNYTIVTSLQNQTCHSWTPILAFCIIANCFVCLNSECTQRLIKGKTIDYAGIAQKEKKNLCLL